MMGAFQIGGRVSKTWTHLGEERVSKTWTHLGEERVSKTWTRHGGNYFFGCSMKRERRTGAERSSSRMMARMVVERGGSPRVKSM